MPSGNNNEYEDGTKEADYIFKEIIEPAVKEALSDDVDINIEIATTKSGAINKNIVREIAESDYAIVDITGNNPNVFFELGMRYVFKERTTILLMQENTKIPFDTHNYRHIKYSLKYKGDDKLKADIISYIKESEYDKSELTSDSLVYDTYPELQLSFENKETSNKKSSKLDDMPWEVYWHQLNLIKNILIKSSYNVDLIIGISNGGMFVADTLERLVYANGGKPILALWSNRLDNKKDYFNNEININSIKTFEKKKSIKILLVDDVVSTGYTLIKAKEFIESQLSEPIIHFIPLFSRNIKYLSQVEKSTIWHLSETVKKNLDSEFNFIEFCYTNYINLPYSKIINYRK